jgi:signal transduction histidine kinase
MPAQSNLLTVINGYAAMLQASTGQPDMVQRYVTLIHDAGQRASSLARKLLLPESDKNHPGMNNLNEWSAMLFRSFNPLCRIKFG